MRLPITRRESNANSTGASYGGLVVDFGLFLLLPVVLLSTVAWNVPQLVCFAPVVLTCAITAQLLRSLGPNADSGLEAASAVPVFWAVSACTMILLGRSVWPAIGFNLATLTFPGNTILIRSLLDVGIWTGLVLVTLKIVSLGPSSPLQRVLGCLVILVPLWLLGIGARLPSRSMIGFWHPGVVDGDRYRLIFDLSAALWFGALIPLLLVRAMLPSVSDALVARRRLRGNAVFWLVGITLSGLIIAVAINIISGRQGWHLDTLDGLWWIQKVVCITLWVALPEEVLFRVCILAIFQELLASAGMKGGAVYGAVLGSAVLFGLAHVSTGVASVLYATCIGVLFGFMMIRTRNIQLCILSHGAIDSILLSWN